MFAMLTIGNYFFVDRNDIGGALFVGFFGSLLFAFVFVPLMEKPMRNVMKKLSAKYSRPH